MARIYSRKKGKSGSNRPAKRARASWVMYDASTVEQLVVKLVKSGKSAAEAGTILRDSYGIPDVRTITGKKIGAILKSHNLGGRVPDDLKSLIRRGVAIMKHLEQHKHDIPAQRGLTLTESKIHRLVRYYKESGVLPEQWTFERSKAKTFIE